MELSRPSLVTDILDIKSSLWNLVFSNQMYIDYLVELIKTEFTKYNNSCLNMVYADIDNMNINISLNGPIANVVVNGLMLNVFCSFIDRINKDGLFDEHSYTLCKERLHMLFDLILNTDSKIIIKL